MRIRTMLCLSAAVILLGAAFTARADVPQTINYQGVLVSGGNPVTTPVEIIFAIWTLDIDGDSLWSEERTVTPDSDGHFALLLGSESPIPDSAFSSDAYLSVMVGADPEMSPRQKLASTGYSFRVGSIDGASGGDISGDLHTNGVISCGDFTAFNGSNMTLMEGGALTVDGPNETITATGGTIYFDDDNLETEGKGHFGPGCSNLGTAAFVAGQDNTADGINSTVSGGNTNTAGNYSAVGGGTNNTAGGNYSTVPGGYYSTASGEYSFATGYYVTAGGANHTMVLGSGKDAGNRLVNNTENSLVVGFNTTTPTLFVGGSDHRVGIGTGSPAYKLDVDGTAQVTGFKMPDGAADGLVLTSDPDGLATWRTVSGGIGGGWVDDGSVVRLQTTDDQVGIGTSSPDPQVQLQVEDKTWLKAGFWASSSVIGSNPNNVPTAQLDIWANIYALRLRAGNSSASIAKNQILLSYNNEVNYTHAIKSRHNPSGPGSNAIDFFVWSHGTNADEDVGTKHVMTLDGANYGRVGIRAINPTASLDIRSYGDDAVRLGAGNAYTATEQNQILFSHNLGVFITHAIKSRHNGDGDHDNALDFYLWDYGTDGGEETGTKHVMTLDGEGDGRVGIGTTDPVEALHVVGNLQVEGTGNIGSGNTVSGTYAFASGQNNNATGNASSVCGGVGNTASGTTNGRAVVGGGHSNTASGDYSVVGGGYANEANNNYAAIAGGYNNTASGEKSVVGGGDGNTAGGAASFIGGGNSNVAGEVTATIAGGYLNDADGISSFIGGGYKNRSLGYESVVSGGSRDTAYAPYCGVASGYRNVAGNDDYDSSAFVGGGRENDAIAKYSTVGGGRENMAGHEYTTVGGGEDNTASGTTFGYSVVGGGNSNTASGDYSVVGGGIGNTASGARSFIGSGYSNEANAASATVAGGNNNTASGDQSVVGGGYQNTAGGHYSTIAGGRDNVASGDYSFVAGYGANATGDGSFVWADASGAPTVSNTVTNRWLARAAGGVFFFTNAAMNTGVWIPASGNSWNSISDRATKENFIPIDGQAILDKLAAMPINEYNIIGQDPTIRHVGPVAQDFYAAFGCGASELAINMEDADGVALAAIKELDRKNNNLRFRLPNCRPWFRNFLMNNDKAGR